MLTKRDVLKVLYKQNVIARVLGIGRSAVCLWPMDEPIPAYRELQLRTLYPREFGPPLKAIARRKNDERRKPPHPLRRATDKPWRGQKKRTEVLR
jgi:hypothetical protein